MARPFAVVIEDQEHYAILHEDALRLVGYDVKTTIDGAYAMAYLQSNPAPDLIILDVNLPLVSGQEIYDYLRSEAKFDDTHCLILTANSMMIDVMQDDIREGDFIFPKPMSVKTFQEVVQSLHDSAGDNS